MPQVLCGSERPIRLPYGFYEELQGEENLLEKQFARPLLIVHGDRDDIVPPSVIEGFAAGHGDVYLHIIDGADHRFKNPGELDRVVEVTRRFLKI
ncbi:MAG: alpha/beta hydrolase [Oscillospiraceae bacterium]|nr:alpha/beta hydrolase [Oscillospiraceae bacterium]